MRRLIFFTGLLLLLLAALWFFMPKWLPPIVAALLPDTVQLRSIEADTPGRNAWTIRSLHLVYADSEPQPAAATQPSQLYAALRRGPIDDVNSLLANYKITIENLVVEHGRSHWQGSSQLGQGQLSLNLAGQLDSHAALIRTEIDLRQRAMSSEISIGDQVEFVASVRPSESTLNNTESRLEFSLSAAVTDVLMRSGEAMRFGVPAMADTDKVLATATSAEVHLSGALDYKDQMFALTLDQQSHALIQNLRVKTVRVPRVRAGLRAPANLTAKDDELLLAPLRFTSNNLTLSHQNIRLPRFRVTGDISLHNSIASGSVHIASRVAELSEQITVSFPFSYSLKSGLGRATVHSRPVVFSEQQRFLPSLIPNWSWPADLVGGELTLSGKLKWDMSDATAQLTASLVDLDAFYGQVLLRGINGTLSLDMPEQAAASGVIDITATELEAGMAATDVRLAAELSKDRVSIVSASASLFKGVFSTSNVNFDPQNPAFSSIVTLENIDLSRLLTIEQGVEGTGIINGQLPIEFGGRVVTISDGVLTARPPGGVIRYTGTVPAAAIDSSPQLQFAVDALKNFHYKVLDINVSYAENGKMSLRVRLEGRNPDLRNGRPVNFNLNVTEDVPSLIKSLMLTRDISDGLQQRIEQAQR